MHSSKIKIFGFFKIALAMQIFYICPPDNPSYSFLFSSFFDSVIETICSNPHNLMALYISSSDAFKLEYLMIS